MKSGPDYGKAHNKSIYLFSLDRTAGKVAHVNYVPQELVKSKKIDAKVWLEQANKVLGGKVSRARAPRSERWRERKRGLMELNVCACFFYREVGNPIRPWDLGTMLTRWTRLSSRFSLSTRKRWRVLEREMWGVRYFHLR
jgi:hypothetical protein